VRDRGLAVILMSHDVPQVWDVADRVHVQRLGKRIAVIDPQQVSSSDGVAIMTGGLDAAKVPSALA
jgi:fructose transport system ATP-binding protein